MPQPPERLIERLIAEALDASIGDLERGETHAVRLAMERETWLPGREEPRRLGSERVELTRRLCTEAGLALQNAEPDILAAAILIRRARALWNGAAEEHPGA